MASPRAPSANEPGGTYKLSGSFGGDTTTTTTLLSSTGSSSFTENKAPTTVTYTGSTSITSGNSPVLSATLTTNGARWPANRDLHRRFGVLGAALQWDDERRRQCELQPRSFNQNASPLPVTGATAATLLRRIDHVEVGDRHHADVPVGERRHRRHGSAHHRHRHADQPGDRPGDQRADHHVDAQRDPVLHGHHELLRQGLVPHHAQRFIGDYPVTGTFAGNTTTLTQLPPSSGREQLRGHCGEHERDLYRRHHGHERLVRDPVVHPDEQRHTAERPERGLDPRAQGGRRRAAPPPRTRRVSPPVRSRR